MVQFTDLLTITLTLFAVIDILGNIPLMISSAGILTATTMISVLKCKNYKNNKQYYYFDLP